VIDYADRFVVNWAKGILGGIGVFVDVPVSSRDESEVSLYLLELVHAPPARTVDRPPLQIALRYLVTSWAKDVEEAHRNLGKLLFAALENETSESAQTEDGRLTLTVATEVEPIPADLWAAFSLAPRPAFILRCLLSLERKRRAAPYVRRPVRVEMSGQRAVRGKVVTVVGEEELPLVGASVAVPKLKLSTRTDAMGVFCFPGVPVSMNQEGLRVVVSAKGKEHEVSFTAVQTAQDGNALLIRFPEMEV
jgi:hypothetical protein